VEVKLQDDEPCVLNDPALHGKHSAEELPPIAEENVPAPHGMHAVLQAAPEKIL
jgi:hypothetical protein